MSVVYVGNNSIGAGDIALMSNVTYVTRAQLTGGLILSTIDAFIRQAVDASYSFRTALYRDNAGAVGEAIRIAPLPRQLGLLSGGFWSGGTDRWVQSPVGFTPPVTAFYWAGFCFPDGAPGCTLATDPLVGADSDMTAGGAWTGEVGALGIAEVVTTNRYSIRLGQWDQTA